MILRHKKMNLIVLVLVSFSFINISGQSIKMNFPYLKGKTYDFIIFNGDKQKKVVQGIIPENGIFILQIPDEYKPYTGMSRWLITNSKEGGGLDMVISGKDFSVSCKERVPDEANIVYSGNSEITELNELNKQQQNIVMKYSVMNQALKIYSPADQNFSVFGQECKKQELAFRSFHQELTEHPDYAKRFLAIVNITLGLGTELFDDEKKRADNIAEYIAGEMDWNTLYTSGHWTTVISSWIDIHTEVLKDDKRFVKDFTRINEKLGHSDSGMYRDFAGRVAYFLTQKGKDDLIGAVSPYIHSSKIGNYEGSLGAYVKGTVGMQAPDLVFTEHIGNITDHNHKKSTVKSSDLASREYKQTLLLFYESGCGHCENLLKEIPSRYNELAERGIQVISISADKDEEIFKAKAKDFLWKYAYCDYDGIQGINFRNYGITGTPTLILVDRSGKIVFRTADLNDLMINIKNTTH